jgi:hypothetical protein
MAARATTPWDSPFPAFSYSESQDQRRRRCARAHYYAVYASHRGWSAQPASDSWIAYRLKKAVPLAAAVGTEVHAAASACVRALLAGETMPAFDVLRAKAAAALNALWKNSRTRLPAFLQAPKHAPLYLESLYGGGPTRAQLHHAAQTLDRALLALIQSHEVWEWVREAARGDVILMDPFTSMKLNDAVGPVICYGAADLIVRPGNSGPWHIVDFKTGTSDGVVDQILTYAVISDSVLKLAFDQGCRGVIVALGERPGQAVGSFSIEPSELVDAVGRIQGGIAASRALLAKPATNKPLPIEAFAKTSNPANCKWCSYRGLCQPEHTPLVAGISDRREHAA